jgi:hypothetical protein
MLALGRKLGFKTRRDAETGDYELQINTGKDAEKQDGERSASA